MQKWENQSLCLTHTLSTFINSQMSKYSKNDARLDPYILYLCHQGREPSPICPRCCLTVGTPSHILVCHDTSATCNQSLYLQQFLFALVKIHTPIYFMALFEYNLSVLLNLPRTPLPTVQNNILLTNICNQNIIGWDLFIKGYTSAYWHNTQLSIVALNQLNKHPPPPSGILHL